MTPNTINMATMDSEMVKNSKPNNLVQSTFGRYEENYGIVMFQSFLNLFAHILIGMIVAISIVFSFRNGLPLGASPMHVVLCVIGYQLLMAEAILSQTSENGWSIKMNFVDKRCAHWILQLLGSGLAIGGSIHKILDKDVHWNTFHGQFALVAMVFTVASLINGLTSLYAYELRRFLPGTLSKLTHIVFGVVAFNAASVTLIFGMDKGLFRNWASSELVDTFIAFTAIMTCIVIFNPLISFIFKTKETFKM